MPASLEPVPDPEPISGILLRHPNMPHRACPVCRVQGRLLEDTSKEGLVEYYRCDKCWRIWTHRMADPNSPPKLATVQAKTPDQSS